MGLERISAVLQGVHANYEIDLFQALLKAAARETSDADMDSPSLKVLADHIRACSFLLADGVIPGNEGRGYVLRRIIRRAIRHGYKLGARAAFFHKMVPDLVAEMGMAYPELGQHQAKIVATLKQEEDRFFETIEHGMAILDGELKSLGEGGVFNGETAFKLHDTYGFPLDLTQDICREHKITVDAAAFDAAMARQKEQARAAGKFKMAANLDYEGPATTFHGYDNLEVKGNVLALYKDGAAVNQLHEGEMGVVVLDDTPFYAESGGQVGDRGVLQSVHGIFAVEDTQKIQATVFGHHGVVKTGTLSVGNNVTAKVDVLARQRTMRNHSATHLLHKALREVLGDHVQQKGSQVDPDKTRFDFVHNQPLSDDEIRKVENIVNAEVLANAATETRVLPIAEAQKLGAMMLFGEKYGDDVRVLDIGSSRELCGGTHVSRTGDIGLFKITAEAGVAAGVRRVEAVTGDNALALVQQQQAMLDVAAAAFKAPVAEVPGKIAQVLDNVRALEKELARLKSKLAASQGDDLVSQAVDVKGAKVLAATLEGADVTALRETMDKLKDKLKSAAIVLASVADGKVTLIAGVTADLTGKVKAGELVNQVAQQVGGKGGGRPDMAQAGGTQPENLPAALASVQAWVDGKL
jgi:alanyl-tRNA synthetase